MGAARRSPGRLPRRVYWLRRSMVLLVTAVVVAGLVLGVTHLTGSPGGDGTDQAAPTGATPEPSAAPPSVTYGPSEAPKIRESDRTDAVLAEPDGVCNPREISAVPALEKPEAGDRVRIDVELQGTRSACTFDVGPDTLDVKVVGESGNDFWRSADCPRGVPREEVVVRSAEPTTVSVRWSSRSSGNGCGDLERWAMPGTYDALATVRGSRPGQTTFELRPPGVRYKTEAPEPTEDPGDESVEGSAGSQDDDGPTASPGD